MGRKLSSSNGCSVRLRLGKYQSGAVRSRQAWPKPPRRSWAVLLVQGEKWQEDGVAEWHCEEWANSNEAERRVVFLRILPM
jgi:hypothetical protein